MSRNDEVDWTKYHGDGTTIPVAWRLSAIRGFLARIVDLEAITEGQLKTITRMNEACVQAEAALAALRENRTEILDSAWNTANEHAIKAEAALEEMRQFWMTAMMAVRFYHELGDEFDCRAAMKSLAEAAEEVSRP